MNNDRCCAEVLCRPISTLEIESCPAANATESSRGGSSLAETHVVGGIRGRG